MAAISSPRGIMPRVASARLVGSSFTPPSAEAPAVAARVATPTMTAAVARAANRPRSTLDRDWGVDRMISSRPSSASVFQRLTWVTAKAIKSTGSSSNMAPRKMELSAVPPPQMFFKIPRAGDARPIARDQGLAEVVVMDRRKPRDPLGVRDDTVDHVDHDEDDQQAAGRSGCRPALVGELGDQKGDASDDGADQGEIQPEEKPIQQDEVGLESHSAEVAEDARDHADGEERRPQRRELLEGHSGPRPRHRKEDVQRAAVLLSPQHAAGSEQRPDPDQKDEDADLEGRVPAHRAGGDRFRVPRELRGQRDKGGAGLRRADQGGDARHRGDDDQAHADAPAEDRDPVIAQRLEVDAPKHGPPPLLPARPARRTAGRRPRGLARSSSAK